MLWWIVAFASAYLTAQCFSAATGSLLVISSPSVPRSTTWEILQKSRNLAAVATLSTGLASPHAEIRRLSVKALLARGEEPARRAILLNWDKLDESDIALVRSESKQFVNAATSLLAKGSLSEKKSALAAITGLDLVQAIDSLLELAVNTRHALCGGATDCLQEICERWGQKARTGKDVPSVRTQMLERLHYKLALFHEHKSLAVVDAWLSLVHWDDSLQRGILSDPSHDVYRSIVQRLTQSEREPLLQLLGGYLWRSTTPKSITTTLVERPEPALAQAIATLLDAQTLPTALKRLRQLPPLQCLANLDIPGLQVGFDIQKKLWLMFAASSDDLPRILRGAIRLSKLGTADGRNGAAEMLRCCRKPDLATWVPAMQASMMHTGREGCLSDLMQEIAGWLESPSVVLKKAAREFLTDFSLKHLLDYVRQWPTQMCKAMASIVVLTERKIDEVLSLELQSPAPKRRLAALQVTEMLGCTDSVSRWLMPLLDDARLDVRVRVIDLLSALGHESLETLIPELLQDASTDIQDAANRAVRRLNRRQQQQDVNTATQPSAFDTPI